jgi:hypothetical protein
MAFSSGPPAGHQLLFIPISSDLRGIIRNDTINPALMPCSIYNNDDNDLVFFHSSMFSFCFVASSAYVVLG